MLRCHWSDAIALTLVLAVTAFAETIPVRHIQKPMHRHIVARLETGRTVAHGEFLQNVQGSEVTMELVYHFLDGSLDDEITTFSQQGTFQLVRTHHVQEGPFFPKPTDVTIEAANRTVTFRTVDENGEARDERKHIDLPRDLANGLIGTLLLNLPHDTKPVKVDMLAPVCGGRVIQILISAESDQEVQLGDETLRAPVFRVHPVLGSFVSILARLIGLQPKDVVGWILEGEDPAVAVVNGQRGGNGPVISFDFVGTD